MFNYALSAATVLLAATGASALSVKQLYQFPRPGTFIENIAFAPNGNLILNTFDQGRVYTLDPSAKNPEPHVLVEVPELESITGIAEIGHGIYAVSGGIPASDYSFRNGSCKVATFNLNDCGGDEPVATIAASIPNTEILNGMVALPHKRHIVLSADSIGGRIFRTNTATGEFDVAFQHEKLGISSDPIIPLGANGLKIYKGYLYFTNSDQQFFARVKINRDGDVVGEIEEIAHLPEGSPRAFDDFSLTRRGDAYVGLQTDSLAKITRDGKIITLIDPESEIKLLQPTSTLLSKDEKTLYVTTGGSQEEGGQVVMVKL